MRCQLDENVSTYHSAKSSLTHGLVQRVRINVFGGRGRIFPLQMDTGPPSGPSGSMGPLRHLELHKGPLLQMPCMQSQPARQATPLGAPVPLLEQPFADLTGLVTGISMLPPVVDPGLPPSEWLGRPTDSAGSSGHRCRICCQICWRTETTAMAVSSYGTTVQKHRPPFRQ